MKREAIKFLANQVLYDMFNLQRELHKHINDSPEGQAYLNEIWTASENLVAKTRDLQEKLR